MISFIIMDLEDSLDTLKGRLPGLKNMIPEDSEIIVLSRDEKEAVHPSGSDDVKVIYAPPRQGVPACWREGALRARGDVLCLMHNDIDFSGHALKTMLEKLAENPRIAAVAPRTANALLFDFQEKDRDLTYGIRQFPQVPGRIQNAVLYVQDFCLLVWREALLKATENLLDARYQSSVYASILLSLELQKQGGRLAVAETEVNHYQASPEDTLAAIRSDEKSFLEEYKVGLGYSSNIRRDMLEMMKPKQSRISVLDVGCALGGNLMLIGSCLPEAYLYGVELDENAARIARAFGNVICADVEKLSMPQWQAKFDFILVGDCLEHLRDPWQILEKLVGYLKENGEIIISLPNINHISIIRSLLQGKFQYEDAGILDRTHLRFFTKESIMEMLKGAGLKLLEGEARIAPVGPAEKELYDFLEKHKVCGEHLMELNAYQWVIRAGRPLMTSIIILNRDLLAYTKLLIESIRKYTDAGSYEIIVVDNGSTDGSVEWLRRQADVKLIANKENVGFPRGCNQGLEISQGQELMLLNNDVVVTQDWLENLRQALYSSPVVGAVGPVTNNCKNMQDIEVPYANKNTLKAMEDMHSFAAGYNICNPRKWHKWMMLTGFCILFKREVYEKIGGLDEAYSPGNYEDDDYCLRMRKAGYELLLCKDTFVHHFGSRTFSAMEQGGQTQYGGYLQKNRAYFCRKWQMQENSYRCYRTFLPELEFADEPVRIIEYNAGSTMDLYILGALCPRGEITGTTANQADLEMGCSYPLIYVPDLSGFPAVLDGEYNLIIIAEDIQQYGDIADRIIGAMDKHLVQGGWLITVMGGQLLRMQKE